MRQCLTRYICDTCSVSSFLRSTSWNNVSTTCILLRLPPAEIDLKMDEKPEIRKMDKKQDGRTEHFIPRPPSICFFNLVDVC